MVRLRQTAFVLLFLLLAAPLAFSYEQIDYVREIGKKAQPKGKRLLNAPRAIALSGNKMYVADTWAHRVTVLTRSGKLVRSWGRKGSKSGQFKNPAGIAVDEQGRVFVSDTGNGRIQVFNGKGKYLRSFGSKGSGPGKFSSPSGLAVSAGLVYVADRGNSRVQILTEDGIFMKALAVRTKKDEMEAPIDVDVDVQNNIYVLDVEGNTVRIFNAQGAQVRIFGTKGKGTAGFDEPMGLAVDQYGNMFIADRGNHKFKKFNAKGKLLGSIGTKGSGSGQFLKAAGLDVGSDGTVSVLDAGKNTIQTFSSERAKAKPLAPASPPPSVAFVKAIKSTVSALTINKRPWGFTGNSLKAIEVISGRTIGTVGSKPGQLKGPRGVAVDGGGNFWVADTKNNRLQKFSLGGQLLQVVGKSGSLEGEFRNPSGVAISLKGNVCVADTGNKRVQVLNARGMFLGMFGKEGKGRGQFQAPVDLDVDESENIYVVDRGNNRIAKFDSNGSFIWDTGKAGSGDGEFDEPENILVSPDGEVYVLDAGNARVQVFDQDGNYLRKFGNAGKRRGEFKAPLGLAIEDGTRLYVGDRGNKRVQVLTLRHTPAVPKGISAQARVNEIQLLWKPNVESYLDQYKVYRAAKKTGVYKLVGVSADPFYFDKNLPSNRTFHYRVSGKARGGNESARSDLVSAVTPRLIPSSPQKVRVEPSEKQLTLSWLPNTEPFFDHYKIYRTRQMSDGFTFLTKTNKTVYVDHPLADETLYYYQITAVGKEGDESKQSDMVFVSTPRPSLTVPPIEIGSVKMGEMFAAAYKYYESQPLGTVVIKNNTKRMYRKVKVSFMIKEFMDFPTEVLIKKVRPGQDLKVKLKPVFSNKILGVTENTPLQSEITLTYYVRGKPRKITRSFPVTLYERHAMTWDQKEKVGAFVTPRDPMVADFSRSVIRPYVDAYPNLNQSLVYARTIYAALGVLGLVYIVDPTSPYQEFSKNTARVDYLQYPRDTLVRKSGDCDDLSILFAASMENIGVATALVDVPGHVFMMFNTGVPVSEKRTLGFPSSQLIVHRGMVWIPVELTLVGSSFTRAWQKGAEQYRDWAAKGKVEFVEIRKAWESFKPVTLRGAGGKVRKVKQVDIENKFKGELETLGQERLKNLSAVYIAMLKKKPKDLKALGQLGILYGENGMHAEALQQFQKMLAVDKNNAIALNNIGNINFMQERLDDARQAYESALAAEPGDTGIMVNLANVFFRMGKKDMARKWFKDAAAIDPRVLRQYGDLAASLGVTK